MCADVPYHPKGKILVLLPSLLRLGASYRQGSSMLVLQHSLLTDLPFLLSTETGTKSLAESCCFEVVYEAFKVLVSLVLPI